MRGVRADAGPNMDEQISLLDAISAPSGWLKLPLAAMQDVGPATQTLAGILAHTTRETFVEAKSIALRAHVPLATARKHIETLHEHGWIEHQGRQRTRGGRLRRTATISVTKQTRDLASPYGVLPELACCHSSEKLSWSARAVLSIVCAQMLKLKAAIDQNAGIGFEDIDGPEDFDDQVENMGGSDRWRFPLRILVAQTGLDDISVSRAKRELANRKLVLRAYDDKGRCHVLRPNPAFRFVKTMRADEIRVNFATVKSGHHIP